tara:strand:- start:624 stop:875 length:252 start_codon:yes stop_codon:yes gene_type:complete
MSRSEQLNYSDRSASELSYTLESEAAAEQSRARPPAPPTWLEVMLGGQHTRDPALKTRSERRCDRSRARHLLERRRAAAQHNG